MQYISKINWTAFAAIRYALSFVLKILGRWQLQSLCLDAQQGDEVSRAQALSL